MTINHFHTDTPDAVQKALLRLQLTGETVRLFYGDTTTGRAWAEEYDVYGYVGNSIGPQKVAILVHPNSHGGPAILTNHIVAIRTHIGWAYKHPSFHTGDWQVKGRNVYHDGHQHAYFDKESKALRYVQFMTGRRLNK